MFPLLETINIENGIPLNLDYHQHRFEASYFKFYKKMTNLKLKKLITVPDEYTKGTVKLRFLYNEKQCFCQYNFYELEAINSLKIIQNDNIDYSLKWVDRSAFNVLLKQKGNADDILIIKNGRVTDTSFSNIVFEYQNQWITPLFPLLNGTARSRLLVEKKITQQDILLEDLPAFSSYKLINAMRDFDTAPKIPITEIIY